MKSFETFTTVESRGEVHVAGVPFAPGTEVEVSISPKRSNAEEFLAAWNRVCQDLRRPQLKLITDDEIQREIDEHRAGR